MPQNESRSLDPALSDGGCAALNLCVIRTTARGDSPFTPAQLDEQLEQDRRLREIKQAAFARQLERAERHNVLVAAERALVDADPLPVCRP